MTFWYTLGSTVKTYYNHVWRYAEAGGSPQILGQTGLHCKTISQYTIQRKWKIKANTMPDQMCQTRKDKYPRILLLRGVQSKCILETESRKAVTGPGGGMGAVAEGAQHTWWDHMDPELPLNYILGILLNRFTVMVWRNCFVCLGDFAYGLFF